MKHTLSLGFPFVFGFSVYESFEGEEVTKTGIVPIPKPDEHLLGGHVGYIKSSKQFIIRNSWGKTLGDKEPDDYLSFTSLRRFLDH